MFRLKDGRFFNHNQCFEEGDIYFSSDLDLITAEASMYEEIDCRDCYIVPGFTDIHIHGAFGYDVSSGSAEDIAQMARLLPKVGVTSFLPTALTLPEDKIRAVLCSVTEAKHILEGESGPYADILGVRLEGPFINPLRAGVQNKEFIRLPDLKLMEDLISEYPGLIRIVDIAPETEGAFDLCSYLAGKGIVVSMAHTDCGYDEAMAFIDAGASSVTHMFNAMKPCEKRSPNLPGAAFDAGINAELICDGIHVDKTIVKMAYKLFGRKICLISDSMSAAGLGDGVYDLGGMKVNVTGNKAMHEGVLAGSVANLLSEVRNLIGWGISAGDAIYSAAIAPKKLLGMDIPSLMPGSRADILVLDKEFGLKKVICKGYMPDAL